MPPRSSRSPRPPRATAAAQAAGQTNSDAAQANASGGLTSGNANAGQGNVNATGQGNANAGQGNVNAAPDVNAAPQADANAGQGNVGQGNASAGQGNANADPNRAQQQLQQPLGGAQPPVGNAPVANANLLARISQEALAGNLAEVARLSLLLQVPHQVPAPRPNAPPPPDQVPLPPAPPAAAAPAIDARAPAPLGLQGPVAGQQRQFPAVGSFVQSPNTAVSSPRARNLFARDGDTITLLPPFQGEGLLEGAPIFIFLFLAHVAGWWDADIGNQNLFAEGRLAYVFATAKTQGGVSSVVALRDTLKGKCYHRAASLEACVLAAFLKGKFALIDSRLTAQVLSLRSLLFSRDTTDDEANSERLESEAIAVNPHMVTRENLASGTLPSGPLHDSLSMTFDIVRQTFSTFIHVLLAMGAPPDPISEDTAAQYETFESVDLQASFLDILASIRDALPGDDVRQTPSSALHAFYVVENALRRLMTVAGRQRVDGAGYSPLGYLQQLERIRDDTIRKLDSDDHIGHVTLITAIKNVELAAFAAPMPKRDLDTSVPTPPPPPNKVAKTKASVQLFPDRVLVLKDFSDANLPPPVFSNGKQLCLSFFQNAKGCTSTCDRAHVIPRDGAAAAKIWTDSALKKFPAGYGK